MKVTENMIIMAEYLYALGYNSQEIANRIIKE